MLQLHQSVYDLVRAFNLEYNEILDQFITSLRVSYILRMRDTLFWACFDLLPDKFLLPAETGLSFGGGTNGRDLQEKGTSMAKV